MARLWRCVVLTSCLLAALTTARTIALPVLAQQLDPESAVQSPPLLDLTPEERIFLANRQIRLGVDPSGAPFEFFDTSGRYSGIVAGFVEAVSARLGVAMVAQPGLTWAEALDQARAGTLDVLPAVTPTPERRKFLYFTRPYATFPAVIATRKEQFITSLEDLRQRRVGVPRGYAVEEILRRDHPDLILEAVDSIDTGLRELEAGRLDAFIDNLGALTHALDRSKTSRLKIGAPTPYTFDLVMGVRKELPLVLSALDKALASLNEAERSEITGRWLARLYDQPAGIDWWTVGPVGAVLLLILFGLAASNRRLGRAVRERKRAEQELQERARHIEARSQAKTRQAELSARLQQASTLETLAAELLSGLAPLAGATHGAFYLVEGNAEDPDGADQRRLRLLGAYGGLDPARLADQIALGECLLGESARSQTPLYLDQLPQDLVTIRSGLGLARPRAVAVLPVTLNRRLVGVIELASFTGFSADQRDLFEEFLPVVAMNVEILSRTLRTQSLLCESREAEQRLAEQTKELQIQQDRLQDTETWFRSIIESAPDGMLVVDEWGSVILANTMLGRMFGYAPEELIGKGMEILVPRPLRDRHQAMRERFVQQPPSIPAMDRGRVLSGLRRDGSEFPVEISLARLPALGVRGSCVCASVRDITARQQAESEIRKARDNAEAAQRQLEDMSDSLPLAVFQLINLPDGSRHYSFVSSQVRRILGVTADEMKADPAARWRHVHPDDFTPDRRTAQTILQRARLGDGAIAGEMEFRVVLGDEVRWALSAAYPKTLDDGTVIWNGFYQDITERKRADGRLQFNRQVVENAGPMVWVDPADGLIDYANAAACRHFGFSADELRMRPIADLDDQFSGEQVSALLETLRGSSQPRTLESRHRTRDGRTLEVELTLFLAEYEGRSLLIISVRDETERKRAQAAIAETEALRAAREAAVQAAEASEQARAVAEQARETLRAKNEEIERFNRLALGREQRILDLKSLANRLAGDLGQASPFTAATEPEDAGDAEGAAAQIVGQSGGGDADLAIKARFIEVVQAGQIQALFENFCDAIGIAAAVIDLDGEMLITARWQRACADFHRTNPDTCRHCTDSDLELASRLDQGQEFAMCNCGNGLTECASPIVVNGAHVANAFVGQFFLNEPDYEYFERQADTCGFDREDYMAAVREVPVIDGIKLISIIGFLTDFAKIVASLSMARIESEQAQARLRLERGAAMSLAEDAELARRELTDYQKHLEQLIEARTGEIHSREEELFRERNELQRMLDSSPIAVGISVGGRLRFANDSYRAWTGLKVGDASTAAYADDGVRDLVLAGLQKDSIVRDFPLRMRTRDGRALDVLATFMKTQYEGEAGILGWLVDVSALKQPAEARSADRNPDAAPSAAAFSGPADGV